MILSYVKNGNQCYHWEWVCINMTENDRHNGNAWWGKKEEKK